MTQRTTVIELITHILSGLSTEIIPVIYRGTLVQTTQPMSMLMWLGLKWE